MPCKQTHYCSSHICALQYCCWLSIPIFILSDYNSPITYNIGYYNPAPNMWVLEHCALVMRRCYANGESVIPTQQIQTLFYMDALCERDRCWKKNIQGLEIPIVRLIMLSVCASLRCRAPNVFYGNLPLAWTFLPRY